MAAIDVNTLLRLQAEHTTDQATLLLDRRGTIVWCNPTAARIFGYPAEDLIGQAVHRLFTPEDVQEGVPDYELHVASRSADMSNDRWLMRADGSRFWAMGSTTALRDDAGEVAGFGKTLRNRTDVKEQLETLRRRADALVQADEHKNIFLSTLSHELRNPLAPLVNALQLIRMTAPEAAALQYPIKLIERQVEFIRRLVDDLLDVTRISAGKIQIDLQPLDVREVIARAVDMTRPLIDERSHRLAQHLLAVPIIVKADAGRLEQVFVNLLTNAAKYTPEGGSIEVRASMEQDEALVHVMDNGLGIPKEMQPHIFELFTQVATNMERAGGGLGIGLSLVKNLVELHGGSVQVKSEGPGRGSEFTVRLPLARPRHTG
ncbi:MAG TPA: PAS domain-containing sensor histidine kinase [Burkholderiales bacterium]|nr:PAS domain-containing sensor histidine kinase [Burkholderiales bacterium]